MYTMKVVFMGSSDFALPALQSLMSNQYDIIAVYTQPDKRTGRGQRLAYCPVKSFAVENGLKVIQPVTFKDVNEVALLTELQPDIIIVAAYGQILPEAVLKIPEYKCINIHPSLLPKYRGPSPVSAAILSGDTKTGVTIMVIEKKVDSGPILSQEEEPVLDYDTMESLTGKLSRHGADLLIETIPAWVSGKIQPLVQDETQASYSRMATRDDGRLDWNLPAIHLWRMTRAFYPWPGCFTMWKGVRLKIIKSLPLDDSGNGVIGEVVAVQHSDTVRAAVRTAGGLLGLIRVQLEGKREMPAADFIAGHRDFIGSVL